MKLFRRKSRPESRPEGPSRPVNAPTGVAKIDRVGMTAIATLQVRELARAEGIDALMGLFHDVNECAVQALVLDLQNLEFLDSRCLGCLVQALNNAVAAGGRVALVNGEGRILDLFRLSRLDRLFPMCSDVPSALKQIERAA